MSVLDPEKMLLITHLYLEDRPLNGGVFFFRVMSEVERKINLMKLEQV